MFKKRRKHINIHIEEQINHSLTQAEVVVLAYLCVKEFLELIKYA